MTDAFVKSATCPNGKSQEIICDSACGIDGKIRSGFVSGLGLRVTERGAKSFVHSYRFNGKARRQVVGTPANMNVASARMIVQRRNCEIDLGNDPNKDSKIDFRKKHGETLGEVIDAYVEQRLSKRGISHRTEFGRLIAPGTREQPKHSNRGGKRRPKRTVGAALRDMLIDEITPNHIAPFLQNITSDSVANSTLRQLRALFNWAIKMQIVDMRNPCSPFEMRKIIKQRRDYSPEQVCLIAAHIFNPPIRSAVSLSGLEGEEKRLTALKAGHLTRQHEQMAEFCAFMGILLLTMARPAEVKQAKFEHFELLPNLWTVSGVN